MGRPNVTATPRMLQKLRNLLPLNLHGNSQEAHCTCTRGIPDTCYRVHNNFFIEHSLTLMSQQKSGP